MKPRKISREVQIDEALWFVEQGEMIDISEASFGLHQAKEWFKKRYAITSLIKEYRLQFNLDDKTIVWYKGRILFRPLDGRINRLRRKGQDFANKQDVAEGREPRYKEMNLLM